jgi:hypothetical protein
MLTPSSPCLTQAVPGFMNRAACGAKLLGDVLVSPLLVSVPLDFRGDVWMVAAKLAVTDKRPDDVRTQLKAITP